MLTAGVECSFMNTGVMLTGALVVATMRLTDGVRTGSRSLVSERIRRISNVSDLHVESETVVPTPKEQNLAERPSLSL